ncbi:IS110 family transposase [Orientia tsutsugamushi]|nr:IS110 family transposase [Orientia tsutsugamushi]
MSSIIVGIEVSKDTFDAAVLINHKVQTRKFNNNSEGFNKLVTWLKSRGTGHVCMEATGIYWKNLAKYLHDYGYIIYGVLKNNSPFNPNVSIHQK